MTKLRVGAAKADISPPLHIPYLGGEPRYGEFAGIHDPLYARATVLSCGGQSVGILSADALGLSTDLLGPGRDFIAEVRRRVAAETDLDPDGILLAATHAHSTPDTYGILRLWEKPECRAWFEVFAGHLAWTLIRAWRDLTPARLGLGQTRVPGVGANRRLRDEQGRICSRGRMPEDATIIDEGCCDDSLLVLLVRREGAAPVVIANFACHPVTVQVQPMMSADYPGFACALVEQVLGSDSLCLFVQGAAGDINPVNDASGEFDDVASFGAMVGGGILQGVGQARLATGAEEVVLDAARRVVPIAARQAPDVDTARAAREEAVAALARVSRGAPEFPRLYGVARAADETYRLAQFGSDPLAAEVQALRLGDVGIATFPGELFCGLGLRVKERSPAPLTVIAACANGCLGYLHPEEAWEHGGYEVGMGAWCRVAAGGSEKLAAAAEDLMRVLFAR